MLAESHIFPETLPPGYEYLSDEPAFEEADLAIGEPRGAVALAELGYPERFRDNYPSPLAITEPFPVLSAQGVEKIRDVLRRLEPYVRRNPRTRRVPAVLRGTAFRSRFIRDLSLSPAVVDHLSRIAGTDLVPTAYSHQLGHTNFPPDDLSQPNVGWHHDENAFVLVLVIHDPATVDGGEFQYFNGTRYEGRDLLAAAGDLPPDRLVAPRFPAAGYAILMQGSAILHRAAPLRTPGYRVSVVTSYDTRDVSYPDPNRFYFVAGGFGDVDPNARLERACRYVEYARHKAWRLRGRLDDFIREVPWTDDRETVLEMFRQAIAEGLEAVAVLERGDVSREQARTLRAAEDQAVED
jgi:hypothetical protein